MSRYIDADEFLENESEAYMRAQVSLAEEHADKTIDATRYVNEAVHKKIQMLINATESADVVEVVRCKDCRHYVNSEHYGMMCEILVHAEQGDNFYCGYGQKKPEQEKWDV